LLRCFRRPGPFYEHIARTDPGGPFAKILARATGPDGDGTLLAALKVRPPLVDPFF